MTTAGRKPYNDIEVIQKIKRMRNVHHGRRKTFSEIAQYLNEKYTPSPTGVIEGWSKQTCQNIASRETPTPQRKRQRKLGLIENDRLSVDQATELYAWLCDQMKNGNSRQRRAARIITVFLLTGIRREELCRLRIMDMPCYHGKNSITVRGKGNTLGSVSITPAARDVFDRACGRRKTGYVFLNESGKKYDVRSINHFFAGAGRKLNLPILRPHVLRHTYASILVWLGFNIVFVKTQLRHLSVATTNIYLSVIYDRVPDEPGSSANNLLRDIAPRYSYNFHTL